MKKKISILLILIIGFILLNNNSTQYMSVINNKVFMEPDEVLTTDINSENIVVNPEESMDIVSVNDSDLPYDKNISYISVQENIFAFFTDTYEYTLNLNEIVNFLNFNVTVIDDTVPYEIIGNENLKDGSVVIIKTQAREGYQAAEYKFTIRMPDEVVEQKSRYNWKLIISLLIVLAVLLVIIIVSKLKMKNTPVENKDNLLQNGSLSTNGVQPITDNIQNNNVINGQNMNNGIIQPTPVSPQVVNQPQTVVVPQPVNQPQTVVVPQQVEVPQQVNQPQTVVAPQQVEIPQQVNQPQTVVVPQQVEVPQQVNNNTIDNSNVELPIEKNENNM